MFVKKVCGVAQAVVHRRLITNQSHLGATHQVGFLFK
jgi:hypothetical protein